jgi:thiamine-monophosphate kinase
MERFFEGWSKLAGETGVELIGGDVSRTTDKIVIDSIAGGEVARKKALLRSGAKPKDAIFVSGALGGAAAGLVLLERGMRLETADSYAHMRLIKRQIAPTPRLDIARRVSELNIATSMIDISDGFSSDLRHLCEAGNVGAEIIDVPVDPDMHGAFDNDAALQHALHGGEDFELLFTVPAERISELSELQVTRVGVVTSHAGKLEIFRDGTRTDLKPEGYRHF